MNTSCLNVSFVKSKNKTGGFMSLTDCLLAQCSIFLGGDMLCFNHGVWKLPQLSVTSIVAEPVCRPPGGHRLRRSTGWWTPCSSERRSRAERLWPPRTALTWTSKHSTKSHLILSEHSENPSHWGSPAALRHRSACADENECTSESFVCNLYFSVAGSQKLWVDSSLSHSDRGRDTYFLKNYSFFFWGT